MDRLKTAIHLAQNQAFSQNKTYSLCGTRNKSSCNESGDWSEGYILFENEEEHHQPNSLSPKIIEIFPGARYGKLSFHSSNTSNHLLHVHANGMTMNFGNFQYTPKNNQDRDLETAKLIINQALRVYRDK